MRSPHASLIMLLLAACDAPPSEPPPEDAGTVAPGPDGGEATPFPGFALELADGTSWEYYWTEDDDTFVQGAGRTHEIESGRLRVTLGPIVRVSDRDALAVTVEGTVVDGRVRFAPRYTHLAADGERLLGFADGTWHVVFDGALGRWPGGGFFREVPDDVEQLASTARLANEYVDTPAVAVTRRMSGGGCEHYPELGQTFCDDDEYTYDATEYFKAGIGPLGFASRHTYRRTDLTISFTIVVSIGLVATSLAAADGFVPHLPAWRTLAPMPTARSRAAAAAHGGLVYVIGGADGAAADRVEAYDPATDAWSARTPMPAGRTRHAAVTTNDSIYVFGGGGETMADRVFRYRPQFDEWSDVGAVPPELGLQTSGGFTTVPDLGAVVVDDVVHAVAQPRAYYRATADRFGLAWTLGPDLPSDHGGFAVLAVGTTVLVAGHTYGMHFGTTHRIDAAGSAWSAAPPLPTPRRDMVAAMVPGLACVIGGDSLSVPLRDNECFDGTTWHARRPMPSAREQAAVASIDGLIFVAGGVSDGGDALATLEVYDPAAD
jgi:hypothetical protein